MQAADKVQERLISIIVPVFRVPYDLLRRCLDSIVAQTSNNYEAILIDDGSPDECGSICEEYCAKYKHFRVIHQENGGLSVVRNVGIAEARGVWISFVDGDDWIEPNTVAFAEEYAHTYPDADVLLWDGYYDTGNNSIKNCLLGYETDKTIIFQDHQCADLIDHILPETYQTRFNVYMDAGMTHARLYNLEFLRKYNLKNKPGLKRAQDNVFNLWVFSKAHKICYKQERLFHYYNNQAAATKRYNTAISDTMEQLYYAMKDFAILSEEPQLIQRVYLRGLRMIVECFKLNYAHPDNRNSLRKRIRNANGDMHKKCFQEIIHYVDMKQQPPMWRIVHFLLKYNLYLLMILVTKLYRWIVNYRFSHGE